MSKQNSLPSERVAYYRQKIDEIMADFQRAMDKLRRDRRELVARIRRIEDEKKISGILGK